MLSTQGSVDFLFNRCKPLVSIELATFGGSKQADSGNQLTSNSPRLQSARLLQLLRRFLLVRF